MTAAATQSSAGMTFSRKPSCYAELRYHKPQQSRPVLTAGLQLNNGMKSAKLQPILAKSASVPSMRLPIGAPMPVMVQHKPDRVGGPVGGDVHAAATNPGFSRNPLGGFYTQIV
jgi:hypothetical protein